jgi:hypothetical protein
MKARLLNSKQMATFAARGFLRFDAIVPKRLNEAFLRAVNNNRIPHVPAGVNLAEAYPTRSVIAQILRLPDVAGVVASLVGTNPSFDHHFLHNAMPSEFFSKKGLPQRSQDTHQDSTIDPRFANFDIQLMYYPHRVTANMGGTRFVPGTHLRKVSEAAVGRYQNIAGQQHVVCPPGTLLVMHHGIWHGGGINRTKTRRLMFKIRLNPTVRQCRLWDTSDLSPDESAQRPIFWAPKPDPDNVMSILCQREPWFEADTGRLEYLNRVRFWRSLIGDPSFDADYWLTRIENMPSN